MLNNFLDSVYYSYSFFDYQDAMKMMYDKFDDYLNAYSNECIFVLEHNNVYTIGKSVSCDQNILYDVPVIRAERGGLWTFHGLGQVVVYFVYDIKKRQIIISDFLDQVECFLIHFFSCKYNIILCINHKEGGGRGLWIESSGVLKKVVFIGLQVKKGIVLHGFSVNVCNDMKFFDYISPCGVDSSVCTSLKQEGLHFDINIFKFDLSNALYYEFFPLL